MIYPTSSRARTWIVRAVVVSAVLLVSLAIGGSSALAHNTTDTVDAVAEGSSAGNGWLDAWTHGSWDVCAADENGDNRHQTDGHGNDAVGGNDGNDHAENGHGADDECDTVSGVETGGENNEVDQGDDADPDRCKHGRGHHRHGRGRGYGHRRHCHPHHHNHHCHRHHHDGCGGGPPAPAPVPTAEFAFSPAAPVAGRDIQFDAATSTGGVDGTTTGTITSYTWDFGDQSTGDGASVAHAYATGGDFTVGLTVTNDYGKSASVSHSVHVASAPVPTAEFSFTPTAQVAGRDVQFNASGSTGGISSDPSGDVTGTIVSYSWDFGDQSTSTGVGPAHAFADGGDFTVALTVTNDYGKTTGVSHTVHVVAAPVPVAAFTYTPGAPVAGRVVQFDGSSSTGGVSNDPSGDVTGAIVSYVWDFGDQGAGAGTASSHSFAATGDYVVTLTVTNDYGRQNSTSTALHVVPPPPPYPGGGGAPVIASAPSSISLSSARVASGYASTRVSVTTSLNYSAPAGVAPREACTGRVLVSGRSRATGKFAAVARVGVKGGSCVAPVKLLLPRAAIGHRLVLNLDFDGNAASGSWHATRSVSVRARR